MSLRHPIKDAYKVDNIGQANVSDLSLTTESVCIAESFGQLVRLGFDVTVFTPASYQRHRL